MIHDLTEDTSFLETDLVKRLAKELVNMELLEEALTSHEQVLRYARQPNNLRFEAASLKNMDDVFLELERIDAAEDAVRKSFRIREERSVILLVINDVGVGLPADHTERQRKSLGHNLVRGLIRQFEGKIEWLCGSTGGTIVKIKS